MANDGLATMPSRIRRQVVVDPVTGCWEWTGRLNDEGYGVVSFGGTLAVYVVTWLLVHGDAPGDGSGTVLDHFECSNRRCCNPAHLREVTYRENAMRGDTVTARNAAKTHCPQGHEYDAATYRIPTKNGRGRRQCRVCARAAQVRYRANNPERVRALLNARAREYRARKNAAKIGADQEV